MANGDVLNDDLLQGTGYPERGELIKRVFDNVIPQKAIQELRRTLELERTTGKPQVLRPLERV